MEGDDFRDTCQSTNINYTKQKPCLQHNKYCDISAGPEFHEHLHSSLSKARNMIKVTKINKTFPVSKVKPSK
jgi:hypothetical protein